MYDRKLLNLRFSAIRRGLVVASTVTSSFLQRALTQVCPVSLTPFDDGDLRLRPSVDRLLNEGTYAPGNICALLPRVNQAKSDLSFETVLGLAAVGERARGLDGVEWMRLCSLMSGGWLACGGKDPGLIPLATYPPPAVFTSQSHVIQHLLLRAALKQASQPPAWCCVGDSQDRQRLASFWTLLVAEVHDEEYPPSAWLRGEVFQEFASWYGLVQDLLNSSLHSARVEYEAGLDKDRLVDDWRLKLRVERKKG